MGGMVALLVWIREPRSVVGLDGPEGRLEVEVVGKRVGTAGGPCQRFKVSYLPIFTKVDKYSGVKYLIKNVTAINNYRWTTVGGKNV